MNKYGGYTLSWAHGRLQWAMDALDHIEAHGLLPVDGRPRTLATDLPAICHALGENADHNPSVQRVRTALKEWNLIE